MIFRLITDEIIALLLFIVIIVFTWIKLSSSGYILLSLALIIFGTVYFLLFISMKMFSPVILNNEGRYESCKKLVKRELERKFSLFNLVKSFKHLNFLKINSAYASLRLDELDLAKNEIESIEEEQILHSQKIPLRMIKSVLAINDHDFDTAIKMLTTITSGKLSDKQLPELFYLISLCYLELGKETERAMNYASTAFNMRSSNYDYKLNFAVALLNVGELKDKGRQMLTEIYENLDALSKFGKQRLLYYLYLSSRDKVIKDMLKSGSSSTEYEKMLFEKFPKSAYLKKISGNSTLH